MRMDFEGLNVPVLDGAGHEEEATLIRPGRLKQIR